MLQGNDGIRRRHLRVRDCLVGVNDPIVPVLEDRVKRSRQKRAQARTNPVHPVCSEGEPSDNCRSKRSGSVHSPASVKYRPEFTDEESEPDSDRRKRGHLVFLDGKHEDCKNQVGRDEHLDEHSLSGVDPLLQRGVEAARTGGECQNDPSGSDRTNELSDAIQHEPDRTDNPCQEQRQTDIRIEQSASDAVEQPRRHQQTESEIDRGYEDVEGIRGGLADASSGRGRLYSSIR